MYPRLLAAVIGLSMAGGAAEAWECPESSAGRLLLPPSRTLPPNASLFVAGADDDEKSLEKTYRVVDLAGGAPRRVRVTCWPSAHWGVSETNEYEGYEYSSAMRRESLCRLTPVKSLEPNRHYELRRASRDGSEAMRSAFSTAAAVDTTPPTSSGDGTATRFFFFMNAAGMFRDKPLSRGAIVLKLHLPRFHDETTSPPLFAIWFGPPDGPPASIANGSDASIGLGLPDACARAQSVPQDPIETVTIRPMDAAGNYGAPMSIAVAKRKPLQIYELW